MAWLTLLVAGAFEVVWASAMKASEGLTRPFATALVAAAMVSSVWLLSVSMKSLPLGTAYPIWTGIGVAGSFIAGYLTSSAEREAATLSFLGADAHVFRQLVVDRDPALAPLDHFVFCVSGVRIGEQLIRAKSI